MTDHPGAPAAPFEPSTGQGPDGDAALPSAVIEQDHDLDLPAIAPGEVLLEVQDLHTTFSSPRGPVLAVRGVTFDLRRGRTLGIVGESGSGKSVLSRSIMGLMPSNASRSGSVRFAGNEILNAPPKIMRSYWGDQMSMVFQDPMTALNPVLRIEQQITESLHEHIDLSKRQAHDTALQLLTSVGIPEPERRLRMYPHEMSGGMRQRIMIAIALACGPKLLFADEPTTALDVTVQAQILDLLQAMQRDRQMAMILVTHDLGVVAGRAHDIAVMYAGRVVEQAPAKALFGAVRHPYTEALLRSIPKLEMAKHTKLDAIGGRPPDLVHLPAGCKFAPRCPYAQERCLVDDPPLAPDPNDPTHLYACHFPVHGVGTSVKAPPSLGASKLPPPPVAAQARAASKLPVPAVAAQDPAPSDPTAIDPEVSA
ncbi:MAG: oligopeptide/dipeptide transporter, ATP-binding protein [Acidimicrobiales bacterium]|nr:oligopeptide/dipeptide transporter, ATP-binding protein [Acidimicrobiales bacterium]